MVCKRCGRTLTQGEIFCAGCGGKVEETMNNNMNVNMNNNMANNVMNNNFYPNQQVVNSNMQIPPKKKNILLKVFIVMFIVILLMVFSIFFLVNGIFKAVENNTDSMVCKSSKGSITIMYTENGVTGYKSNGFKYNLDEQQELANEVGIDEYLKAFAKNFNRDHSGTCKIDGKEVEIEEEKTEIIDGKVIGSSEYGYLTVPNDWVKFIDVDGNDSIQYSYANIYIVSLNYLDANGNTAEDYASNFMYNKQNDPSVTNVTGAKVTIGKNGEYSAYQVYMLYPSDNIYLITYWFETGDGKVRYIALEGPEKSGDKQIYDFLSIAESFSLNENL